MFYLRYRVIRFIITYVTFNFEQSALNVGLMYLKEQTLNRLKVSLKDKDPLFVTALH